MISGWRPFRAITVCVMTCGVALQSGCAPPAPCDRLGGAPMLEYQLYFGRSVAGRPPLTDDEWAEFARLVITPNLPDGFTALDADGQWMNPTTRRISSERTKMVIAAAPNTPASAAGIAAIKDAYRTQYHQQSVGMLVRDACGAF